MALEVWILAVVWLALGAVIALYLYRYMDKEGKVEIVWVIIGLLLSVLGLLAFIAMRSKKDQGRDKAVDPKRYEPPSYKMEGAKPETPKEERPQSEEPKPVVAPKKEVKQIAGIPRCPSCGAAISHVDKKCPDCGAKLKD